MPILSWRKWISSFWSENLNGTDLFRMQYKATSSRTLWKLWHSVWKGKSHSSLRIYAKECNISSPLFSRLQYTCLICNLFDDSDKRQYHCDQCGICRIGGKENFFHCKVCNMCLPLQLKIDGHRVIINMLNAKIYSVPL